MENEIVKSLLELPSAKFRQHLQLKNNERIIFSGRFGAGKTTFLREFFNSENQIAIFNEVRYNVIKLFPVNYSIATNEDIIKYIKYDIILEMLNSDIPIEEIQLGYEHTSTLFFNKNYKEILLAIASMIPLIGKELTSSLQKIVDLEKQFADFHKETKAKANDKSVLQNYIAELQKDNRSIFENDIISSIIEKTLHNVNERNAVENVLVIDDLDRIDPEHIFRILNVFAAHLDRKTSLGTSNKFGFDKIIIVCDIDNIRQIFKAKYGLKTDFNGYVDKFYSHRIFDFDNKSAFKSFANDLIYQASWVSENSGNKMQEENFYRHFYLNKSSLFTDVFDLLLYNSKIDMRNIVKYKSSGLEYSSHFYLNNREYEFRQYPTVFYLRLLSQIKGDWSSLKDAIIDSKLSFLQKSNLTNHISDLLYIITLSEHKEQENLINYKLDDLEILLRVTSNENNRYSIQHKHSQGLDIQGKHLISALCDAIDFVKTEVYFQR